MAEAGRAPDIADARRRSIEAAAARVLSRADEAASNTAMHRLAAEKSLRKSAQSGLCDAKSDTPAESFF
jgi:hypothetical protein